MAPFDKRLRMAELLQQATGSGHVTVCGIENALGDGPSYTFETLRALKTRFPTHRFTLILGSDARAGLSQWHRGTELAREAAFYFVPRKGYEASDLPEVSSSQVRARLAVAHDVSDLVPPAIAAFVAAHGLYRASKTSS
jgi:nicotinate-nucleotide adenylyltransferase